MTCGGTHRSVALSLRRLTKVGLVAVVVLASLAGVAAVVRPGMREWIAFRLRHQIGAPSQTSPAEPFLAHDPPATRLAAAGDVGTGGDDASATGAAMETTEAAGEYDALLLLGDNVYPDGDPGDLDRAVFDPFADVLDGGTRLLAALGNHDVRDGNGDEHAAAIGMPSRWYATRIDDVLVVTLDSTQPDNPDQSAWLDATLASDDATWTIAFMHHPPYSGGYHGSSLDVRDAFSETFESHGVQLVLAGHDHDYQRSRSINGVTYVVSGGAAKLRPASRADFTETAWSTHHFIDIAIWPDRMLVRPIDHEGAQFDSVIISP